MRYHVKQKFKYVRHERKYKEVQQQTLVEKQVPESVNATAILIEARASRVSVKEIRKH
jgi:hypothetical protein